MDREERAITGVRGRHRKRARAGKSGGLRLLREGMGQEEADVVLLARDETVEEEGPGRLLCRACRVDVTAVGFGIRRHGRFEHAFENPAGYSFRVGCFSTAWNCLLHGIPTYAHTWFPGFRWRFCACGRCGLHLGWQYDSGAESFFGLILDSLARENRPH